METVPKNLWWGYLHINGTLQVKRYFGREDLFEAQESPFVDRIAGPWPAKDRDDALEILKEVLS